jgi:phospholipid/cholesterol/gamma-HCH transport system substrate-binding protein
MPRTRSLAWSELKIGILAVSALALAAMIIIAVGGQSGFFWDRYHLKTKFDNVQGLKSGAIVRVAGVEVGKVTAVEFAGPSVEITLALKNEMKPRVTSDSRASIGSLSLLGEPVIDISPAATGTPLKDGDFIQPGRAQGQIADVAASASEGIDQLTGLLKDIRAGKGSVGKLFTDQRLYSDIDAFVESAQVVSSYLSKGQGTLGKLLRDPESYRKLNGALGNLEEVTQRINAGEGSLGRLLNDDALARSLTSASANVDQITGRLNQGEGTAGKLLTEKELYDRVNGVAARLETLTTDLSKGQGTAGQLLHDKQLYDNMNAAANELRGLIADVRKDPKKYLNVRVSIF